MSTQAKVTKIKDVVSWVMGGADKILKLSKADETYDIADDVFKFMEAKGLVEKEEFEVEVEVDSDQGDNSGTIVRLSLVGDTKESENTKKTDTKETKNSESESSKETESKDNVIKELTVAGVSVKNKGVTFKEEEKVWYTLSDDIDPTDFKNKCTKKLVEVVIEPTNEGNDIIQAYVLKEQDEPEDTDSKSSNSYETNTQKSIEAQVAVEHAQILAGAIAGNHSFKSTTDLNEFIDARAKRNFRLIQELKRGE